MWKFLLLICSLISLTKFSLAQDTSNTYYHFVNKDHAVEVPIPQPMVEANLAVDPDNPKHLLGTAIIVGDKFELDCAAFATLNGGQTWVAHEFDIENCADPWVEILSDGTAVFVSLSTEGMMMFKSTDGGISWNNDHKLFQGGFDHPIFTKELREGGKNDILYLAASQMVTDNNDRTRSAIYLKRSDDSGQTFTEAVTVIPNNLNQEVNGSIVLSDGILIISFGDHHSPNGKLETRRSWIIRSKNGGKSFSEPLFVAEDCASEGYITWPSLAADISGGIYNNRLYWICESKDFKGIQLFVSGNKGESWGKVGSIGYSAEKNIKTRNPRIAVNNDGIIGLVWYGVTNKTDTLCYDIYFSVSKDGGNSFLPARKVSTAISCPDTKGNKSAFNRWRVGGDYSGIAAGPDGTFHILWSDSRSGIYSLRTASIKVIK